MQIIKDIFLNHMIIVPIISWAVSQIIKTVVFCVTEKKIVLKRILGDGGMPSAHASTVFSLAVMCGWTQGFDSAAFAISIVVAVVILRDAVGVRWQGGVNARVIKKVADKVNSNLSDGECAIKTDKLKTIAGHTPLEVAMGCVTGLAVCILYILIGNIPSA